MERKFIMSLVANPQVYMPVSKNGLIRRINAHFLKTRTSKELIVRKSEAFLLLDFDSRTFEMYGQESSLELLGRDLGVLTENEVLVTAIHDDQNPSGAA
jgi:hypothetical protein